MKTNFGAMTAIGLAAAALSACASKDAPPPAAIEPAAAPVVEPVAAAVPRPNNPMLAEWTGPYGGVPAWDRYNTSQFG